MPKEIQEKAVYTREEAENLLRISRSTMMRLIKKEVIQAAKNRWTVPYSWSRAVAGNVTKNRV